MHGLNTIHRLNDATLRRFDERNAALQAGKYVAIYIDAKGYATNKQTIHDTEPPVSPNYLIYKPLQGAQKP